ncbi:hypothetical protein [Vibrio parahaemolyticus]|uniref:hypothetical protein n=1 Tax=Vibrio parahaemolyticus TaxID=670 RepID=UPI001F4FF638|nr:hypothetical protein [Vibrio parahaemolyticus]EGR3453980.1 hypothetical protein [Vibrio parahaemolyticus]
MRNRSIFGWKLSESRVVSVAELESGTQDDVVCPCCGDFMVAAHSNKGIASYLRHQSNAECLYAYETQLHLSAKEFIEREKAIPHPYSSGIFDSSDCEMVGVKNVRLEVYRDGRIPDIVCQIGREEYYVEVTNTHETPPDKIVDFRRQGRSALELFLVGLDSDSLLSSYENVKVQITALNPLNPFWDFIEQQAAVSISKERSMLLRKIARHRKQVQRITESISEREEKAEERVARIKQRVEKWRERELEQKELYKQIESLANDLQVAVLRLKEEKSSLNQELEQLKKVIYIKRLESEKIINNARLEAEQQREKIRAEVRNDVLADLASDIEDAKQSAHMIEGNARRQESTLIEEAHKSAKQILDDAHNKVANELEAALKRKGISSAALIDLESRVYWLKQETEALEEKQAELESGVNLDELWRKKQDLLGEVNKEISHLNEIKELGDKYVKIMNGIVLDFKQLDTSDYFSLLPERVQKKIKTNRMILEMQNAIEYEPMQSIEF